APQDFATTIAEVEEAPNATQARIAKENDKTDCSKEEGIASDETAMEVVELLSRVQRVMDSNVMTPRSTYVVFKRIGFAIQKGLAAQLVARLPSTTIGKCLVKEHTLFSMACNECKIENVETAENAETAESAEIAENAEDSRESPSTAIEKKTPIKMWSGHPSDYGMLRTFGCVAYLHVQQDQDDGDDEDAGDQEIDQPPDFTDYQLVRDRKPRTRTKPLRF
nr:ATPase family AAA domain-containing protein [Tanacetum cinerariifolium]